jgi:hypothetical protein
VVIAKTQRRRSRGVQGSGALRFRWRHSRVRLAKGPAGPALADSHVQVTRPSPPGSSGYERDFAGQQSHSGLSSSDVEAKHNSDVSSTTRVTSPPAEFDWCRVDLRNLVAHRLLSGKSVV